MEFILTVSNYIFDKLSYVSSFLTPYLPWYGVVFIFSLVYLLVYSLVMSFFNKEVTKRKQIVQELNDFRKSNPADKVTGKTLTSEEYMRTILQRKQYVLPDDYYEKMWEIVEKRKPKPILMLMALTLRLFIAGIFFAFFLQIDTISHHILYFITSFGLMSVLLIKRSKIVIRVIIWLIIGFVYWQFTSAALLFSIFVSSYRILIKKIKK